MRPKYRTIVVACSGVLSCIVMLAGCSTHNSNGPGPSAWRYAQALAKGDVASAAQETTDPDHAKAALSQTISQLNSSAVEVKIGKVNTTGTVSDVAYQYRWQLPVGTFSYAGHFMYVSTNGVWKMRWNEQDIHPSLGTGQSMKLQILTPDATSVNVPKGGAIIAPSLDERITFQASAAGDPTTALSVAQQLVAVLGKVAPNLNQDALMASGNNPVLVAQFPQAQYDAIDQIHAIEKLPGVAVMPIQSWKATDKIYSGVVESTLKNLIQSQGMGKKGFVINRVDTDGNPVQVLSSGDPTPAEALTVTLDPATQRAAWAAANWQTTKPVIVVAVQPSSGNIIGLAENSLAQRSGMLATNGLYPPGSTFKIITASASLETMNANPDTIVPCPGTITIANRTIPNFDRFNLGDVSMRSAFAHSCNTSFAYLASKLDPHTLSRVAAQFGIGDDWDIPGLPSVSGTVTPTANIVERSEDGFGQGKDLVTPLSVAMVSASVAHGAKVIPQFVINRPTKVNKEAAESDHTFLNPQQLTQLRSMMRAVVTQGTARSVAAQGEVYGKTGEAEFTGGSHAWFTGYRGDVAFAVLVVGGGDSERAVEISSIFLNDLP